MQVIARRTLKEFWQRHPQAEKPIRLWFAATRKAQWREPSDVKQQFGTTVDFVHDNRVIFDLGGSYKHLTALFKGTYSKVSVEHRAFEIVDGHRGNLQ